MPPRVEGAPTAERDLRPLDHQGRERVRQAIYRFAWDGRGDVARLQGREGEWRLCVGPWRVLSTVADDSDAEIIRILPVLPRGRADRD